MDNYKTVERNLENRLPIRGNSISAYWDDFGNYQVYSYSTLIANIKAGGERWVDPRKYSVTTSRHQNLIRKAWGLN